MLSINKTVPGICGKEGSLKPENIIIRLINTKRSLTLELAAFDGSMTMAVPLEQVQKELLKALEG